MSDSEQHTAKEQPEDQPVADTPAAETEEQPAVTGEDTATSDETPTATEEPQPDEAANAEGESAERESGPSASDPEPKPAEEDKEVEIEAATAEGENEPEPEPEPEPEVKEEPVVITPEGSPFWLSNEDVLAKGLAEDEVENFKDFFFRQSHSLQAWYDQLKDHAIQSEFITLSKEEIEALSVEGEVSEEQQQVLSGLEDRVNQAIELFEEDGAVVRVNERSADDSIYERDEETFIAQVRDEVINELEVEKQRANAYSIWKEQERPPGAFKRGINSLRASLRRTRAHSTGRREAKPKLEEEKKEDKKDEEKQEESPKDETTEVAEGDEATGGDTTVEVEVENDGEDKPADDTPASEEAPKDEVEAPKDEEEATETPKDEGEGAEAPKEDSEIAEAPKDESEATPKENEEAPKEESEAKEDEIEKVEEATPVAPKQSPVHYKLRKAKTETLDNQVLRAFLRSTTALFKVKTGKEAIDLLRRSLRIRTDLNQLKAFGGVEGVQVSLSVCRWQEQVASYPGMEFRGFVYKNELNALSQYNDTAYYPHTDIYFNTVQAKVLEFFNANIQELLKELENYCIDFYVSPEKVLVMRLNPFYTAVEACLFPWSENGKVLTQGPFEFRIVDAPRTAPEAFSSFQPFWQTMLQSVLDQRSPATRPNKTCTLL